MPPVGSSEKNKISRGDDDDEIGYGRVGHGDYARSTASRVGQCALSFGLLVFSLSTRMRLLSFLEHFQEFSISLSHS